MELIIGIKNARENALGKLGESLAEDALKKNGFTNVRNLNLERNNHPYADIVAEKEGNKYLISVKTRNENQQNGKLNTNYNCIKIAEKKLKKLKNEGLSKNEITELLINQVQEITKEKNAIPAWITIPVRTDEGTYAIFFGLLGDIGLKRSISMTYKARDNYKCLISWTKDPRITPGLTNKK